MIRAVYDCNVIMSGIGWNGAARNCLKLVRRSPRIIAASRFLESRRGRQRRLDAMMG
jgi:hypothetical protein